MRIRRNSLLGCVTFVACTIVSGAGCNVLSPAGMTVPDTVPNFSAAKFTNPTQIDNQFLPLVAGTTRTFQAETQDGKEETVIEVLADTHEVMGVTCRVVRDRVFLDNLLIEDTHDFFAQDDAGNVWYMGEQVDDYNYDNKNKLIDITHEGSWEAGQDVAGLGTNASPGHAMKATPVAGEIYHQEFYRGEAEDMAEVVALDVPVRLADGTLYSCLQTRDFTRFDPQAVEFKFYAPGIGLVVEELVNGGDRAELVSVKP